MNGKTRAYWVSLGMLVLVAASPSNAKAQEYGVMLGYSYSGLSYPDTRGQSGQLRRAIPVGALARQSLSHSLSIEEEVALVTKGAGGGPGVLARYLEAPVLLEFVLAKPHSAASYGRPYLLLGPSVALRLNCELTEPGVLGTTDCQTALKDYGLRRFDAGVVTGFGFEFGKERRPRQQLELRYTGGLVNIGRGEHTRSYVFTAWFKTSLRRQAP